MIPTTEEIGSKHGILVNKFNTRNYTTKSNCKSAMIEFAKLHVQLALESAAKNTKEWHGNHGMLKQSILNAYPLTNIK